MIDVNRTAIGYRYIISPNYFPVYLIGMWMRYYWNTEFRIRTHNRGNVLFHFFNILNSTNYVSGCTFYLDFFAPRIIQPPAVLENALTVSHIDLGRAPEASFTSE